MRRGIHEPFFSTLGTVVFRPLSSYPGFPHVVKDPDTYPAHPQTQDDIGKMRDEAVRQEGTLTVRPPAKEKSKGKGRAVYKSPPFVVGDDGELIETEDDELGSQLDEDEEDAEFSTEEIPAAKKPTRLTAAEKGKKKKVDVAPATTPQVPPPAVPPKTPSRETTPLLTPPIDTTRPDSEMVVPDSQLGPTDAEMASPEGSKLTTPDHSRAATPLLDTPPTPPVKSKRLSKKEAKAVKAAKSAITKAQNRNRKAAMLANSEEGRAAKADKRVRSPSATSPSSRQSKRAKGTPTRLTPSDDEDISGEGLLKPAWGHRG